MDDKPHNHFMGANHRHPTRCDSIIIIMRMEHGCKVGSEFTKSTHIPFMYTSSHDDHSWDVSHLCTQIAMMIIHGMYITEMGTKSCEK